MALLNYIADGTYSVITQLSVQRIHNMVEFTVTVYSDAAKSNKLASNSYMCSGNILVDSFKSIRSSPPDQLNIGDAFLTSPDAEGEWSTYPNCIARWNGTVWQFWTIAQNQVIFHEEDNVYLHWNIGGEPSISSLYIHDCRVFERFFGQSIYVDSNTFAKAYEFLKLLPEFTDCIDA